MKNIFFILAGVLFLFLIGGYHWLTKDVITDSVVYQRSALLKEGGDIFRNESTEHSVTELREFLKKWDPSHYDAEFIMDGILKRPGKKPGTTLIPPAFAYAANTKAEMKV